MTFPGKRVISAGFLLLFIVFQAPCQNLEAEFYAGPTLSIPLGPVVDGDLPLFSLGGGMALRGDIFPSSLPLFFLSPALDADYMPLNGAGSAMTMIAPGLSLGVRYEAAPRLVFKAFGGGGLYYGMSEPGNVSNPFIAGGGEIDLKLNPSLSLGLGGRYRLMTTPSGSLYEGISLNLGVGMDLRAKRKTRGMEVFPLLNPIFPLFFTYYDDNPAGTVTVRNGESLRYDNVTVSFHANQYMDGYKVSGTVKSLRPGEEISLPVYAPFTPCSTIPSSV